MRTPGQREAVRAVMERPSGRPSRGADFLLKDGLERGLPRGDLALLAVALRRAGPAQPPRISSPP
jgi:hypothetical protein